jgi:hypothetical protein
MRIFPQELLILKLKGQLPRHPRLRWVREMTDEDCLKELREYSGLNLGKNPEAWEKWWSEEKKKLDIDPDF